MGVTQFLNCTLPLLTQAMANALATVISIAICLPLNPRPGSTSKTKDPVWQIVVGHCIDGPMREVGLKKRQTKKNLKDTIFDFYGIPFSLPSSILILIGW